MLLPIVGLSLCFVPWLAQLARMLDSIEACWTERAGGNMLRLVKLRCFRLAVSTSGSL